MYLIAMLGFRAECSGAGAVSLTGWFACDKCTRARVTSGDIRPSHPDCAKACINKGSDPVFLSEQGKESLKVKNYTFGEDLGYRVEVTGHVDAASKTITIETVKRLESGTFCSRRRKN
jgi:hypothetical protein